MHTEKLLGDAEEPTLHHARQTRLELGEAIHGSVELQPSIWLIVGGNMGVVERDPATLGDDLRVP